jgi:hypothetical protein
MANTVWLKSNATTGKTSLNYTVHEWITRNIKINYLLIFLLAYTAFSKLHLFSAGSFINLIDFKTAMLKSPVLRPYIHELAYIIPISEIAVCLLLLFNNTKKWGYYFSLALLTLFTSYIVFILIAYSHHLPCVCGGVISHMSWPQHLLFNLFFIAITMRAIYLTSKK